MVRQNEIHEDLDSDKYTSAERSTVVNQAADELELIAVSKRLTELFSHAAVVRTTLEALEQETESLQKIWCVKMMDDVHAPKTIHGQLKVMKIYLKPKYRLSDLLRAQRNDKMTSILKKWIENGAPNWERIVFRFLKHFNVK